MDRSKTIHPKEISLRNKRKYSAVSSVACKWSASSCDNLRYDCDDCEDGDKCTLPDDVTVYYDMTTPCTSNCRVLSSSADDQDCRKWKIKLNQSYRHDKKTTCFNLFGILIVS